MIGIIDYGIGNIQAFLNLFDRLNLKADKVKDSLAIKKCSHLILPGVGHFDEAMSALNSSGLRPTLEEVVMYKKTPILGVCVGMQMLGNFSDEGKLAGLGWIPGNNLSLKKYLNTKSYRIPHMGWNSIEPVNVNSLFDRTTLNISEFYFLHSFFFKSSSKKTVTGKVKYGIEFDAAISLENIHGIQCHPEKSHKWGENLLKKFSEL